MKIIDEETYLASCGLSRLGIGDSALHKNRGKSERAWKSLVKIQVEKDVALINARQEKRKEYALLIKQGKIRPPTRIEMLVETANGNPDCEATQAARRLLGKRK